MCSFLHVYIVATQRINAYAYTDIYFCEHSIPIDFAYQKHVIKTHYSESRGQEEAQQRDH